MARTLEQLQRDLAQARGTYGGQFAGQPRVTRDPSRLEALVQQARAVSDQAAAVEGGATLAQQARDQAAAWADELTAIREVQARGPRARQASSVAQWMRDGFERYRRHFAGQNRATRDLGILLEIAEDMERRVGVADALLARGEDPELARSRGTARQNLETYRSEIGAIRDTRRQGSPEERAGRLAGLANDQFSRYRLHFAGKARISRRRQVLETIVAVLEEIRGDMAALRDQGTSFAQHAENIRIVDGHLDTYRAELQKIRGARNAASRADRIQSLAEAANAIFKEYRDTFPGHRRSTRDEDHLSRIWEQLWPVALEMEDLAREDDAEPVGSNLQKVRDSLRLYEREWHLIRQAKGLEG
jgi:hypothetical protein